MLATLTYTAVVVFAMGIVGLIAATAAWGFNDLTSLSGTTVGAAHGLVLLVASLGVYIWPMAGIAAFGLLLSTVTRNSAASVVGTLMWALLMQLLGVLPGTEPIRPYLLGTQFEAWHGFLRTPVDWAPVIRALWVCADLCRSTALRGLPRSSCGGTSRATSGARWQSRRDTPEHGTGCPRSRPSRSISG